MTALDRYHLTEATAALLAVSERFDEHWLRDLQWTLLQDRDGLVWWRVRAPLASRSWLVLRPRVEAGEAELRGLDRVLQFAQYLDPAWAVLPVVKLNSEEGPLLVLDDDAGRPLATLADGKIAVERFLRLACAAASALAAAHAQGITHRDIKPANFILGADNELRLSGFMLAAHDDVPKAAEAEAISGSPAYMSPEQSGRLNQAADQRSDLYSLGVTFYELLTGHLPFNANDTSGWLHQHVAVQPLPLSHCRQGLPSALQWVIDRLLAKAANERFGCAAGLASQLRRALSEWNEFGHISEPVDQPGNKARVMEPARLLGRDIEYGHLSDAARRLGQGQPGGMLWISAPAGMGKTALVRQLRSELAGAQLMFGSGKFEDGVQKMPYAALAAVLTSVLTRVVGDEPEQVARCGMRLKAALGGRGQLLARLVPEIEWVTGPLPESNEPAPAEAQRRLLGLFRRALRALACAERPVIVFFDDVHWLDAQSLVFFQGLRSEDFQHLLLIAAYHSDADNACLSAFLAAGRAAAIPLHELKLRPLNALQVRAMVDASLVLPEPAALQLAHHLLHLGAGSPLFVIQSLQGLLEAPQQAPGSHLVLADLAAVMSVRLARLPDQTRATLCFMALLGSHAERESLALACALDAQMLSEALAPAIGARLIREGHDGMLFCHDHVQAAALRLLPARQLGATHLLIARRFAQALDASSGAEQLFRAAAHVLQADLALLEEQDRQQFVDLLIRAAHCAKASAAAPFALDYLAQASNLLARMDASVEASRAFEMAYLRAQCLILNTQYAQAEAQIVELLGWVDDSASLVALYVLKTEILLLAGDYQSAVGAAVDGLACLGLRVDVAPSDGQAEEAWAQVQACLHGRSIASLHALPLTACASVTRLVELLTTAGIIGTFVQRNLMFVLLCHGVRLTLEHGLSAGAARTFAWFGVSSAHRNSSHGEGLEWAQLALHLVDRHGYEQQRASVLLALDRISVWSRPIAVALGFAEQALRTSLTRETPVMGCYANNHIVSDLLVMGAPIERTLRQIDTGLLLAQNLEFIDSQNILYIQALYIRRLAGEVGGTVVIPGRDEMARRMAVSTVGPAQYWWHLFEGISYYLEGNLPRASVELELAWSLSWSAPAHVHLIDLALFSVLNAAARLEGSAAAQVELAAPLERLRYLATLNPQAFGDRLDLARAQVLQAQGRPLEALRLYDEAVAKALACGAVHIQGLAHELAGRCHEALGLAVSTRTHLRRARDCWRQWGAHALAEQLEAQHPYLQERAVGARASVDLPGGQQQLDMMSITKACQALSRELQVEQLLKTLLANTIVHAGASHAALLLIKGDGLRIEALGHAGPEGVDVNLASHAPRPHELPMSLVRTALRSRRSIVIESARDAERFVDDPYLRSCRTGSMLCVPLLMQNEIIGVLYLENLLVAGVFNPARVDVLEVLAAQAAISLTTARLYQELLEENRCRRASETRLKSSQAALRTAQAEMAQISQRTVLAELAASIAHEINQPLLSILANASASLRWLERDAPALDEATEGVRDILSDGRRAADIVSAIRSLASLEPMRRQPLALDALVQRVVELTRSELDDKRIVVHLHADKLPMLQGDPVQLQQVVLNLISNAAEAMQKIESDRRILRLHIHRVANGIVLLVEDNGPGVAVQSLEQIFEPFYSTKAGGMGMGLAICRSIVEGHGGRLLAFGGRRDETLFALILPADS